MQMEHRDSRSVALGNNVASSTCFHIPLTDYVLFFTFISLFLALLACDSQTFLYHVHHWDVTDDRKINRSKVNSYKISFKN